MPRPNKAWYRKDVGWWMASLSGSNVTQLGLLRLAKSAKLRNLDLA
jgi:hypothetical protein